MIHQFRHTYSSAAGFFFLFVYFIASYGSFFHSDDSNDHVHEHGISLEEHILISSACHNTIYHAIDEDCGHSEHFSPKDFKQFIDVEFTFQKAYLAQTRNGVSPNIYFIQPLKKVYSGYSNPFFYSKTNRGPPVFVS